MILRLLPIIILTLILPDLYIYFTFWKKRSYKQWKIALAFLPDFLLLIGGIILCCNETLSPKNLTIIGIYLVIYMLVALPKTTFLLVDLLLRLFGLAWHPIKKYATPIAQILRLVVFICILIGTFYGPTHLVVKKAEVKSQEVPESFNGYRIVQFTDLHLASFEHHPTMIRTLVDTINALHPDMIVFTGDLVNTEYHELLPYIADLSRLNARDGVFSILGNHDYHTYTRNLTEAEQAKGLERLKTLQRAMDWDLLLNENRIIRKGNDSIAIIGVENDGKPPFPERGDLRRASAGVEKAVFKILLSHDPSHWKRKVVEQTDIQLTLSGHTHGMQLMLFGWSPSKYVYPEWRGMYTENKQSLYVSLGVGGALIPFRLGAWPEINVITLRH